MLNKKNNVKKYLSVSMFLLMSSFFVVGYASAQEIKKEMELPSYRIAPNPIYSKASMRNGEEGTAMIKVVANINGELESINLYRSSGFIRLDESAIEAVKKVKFNPYISNNQKTQETFIIPIKFVLEPALPKLK